MTLKILLAILAAVTWGERPDLLGPEEQEYGAQLVCHTFLNWLEADYEGEPDRLARERFWGWQVDTPEQPAWVFRVVSECFDSHLARDPTFGAYFVFSYHDVADNRWTWYQATAQAGRGTWGFFTFRQIPPTFPKSPILMP